MLERDAGCFQVHQRQDQLQHQPRLPMSAHLPMPYQELLSERRLYLVPSAPVATVAWLPCGAKRQRRSRKHRQPPSLLVADRMQLQMQMMLCEMLPRWPHAHTSRVL